MALKPLRRLLDAQVANWIARPGLEQAPIDTLLCRGRQADAPQQLFTPEPLRKHIDEKNRPVRQLQRLQANGPLARQRMGVARAAVIDGPLDRVA